MDQEHFRKLERMYHAAPCNRYYWPRMTIGEGTAEVVIPVRPELFHAAGAAHGALHFKALDDAGFFAANSVVRDVFVLTKAFELRFLRPLTSGSVRGVGKVTTKTEREITADAVAYDDAGNQVARGTGTFAVSRIALTADMGYL